MRSWFPPFAEYAKDGEPTVQVVHRKSKPRPTVIERMIARVRKFLEEGVAEDEPEFVVAVKEAKPKITARELEDVIRQFRAVVSERQQRDLRRR
jgi:hypothetical protein